MPNHLILYAPNVHTGGGLSLLKSLLNNWSGGASLTLFLDSRAKDIFVIPVDSKVFWVKATLGSRLFAEYILMRKSKRRVTVLCFHGLPPLLSTAACVIIFQQNRNHFGLNVALEYSLWDGLRASFERLIARLFSFRASQYIVQTPSMYVAIHKWFLLRGVCARPVKMIPFFDMPLASSTTVSKYSTWDFIYIADGSAHKNHRNLLKAWELLAHENLRPSLALTLYERDHLLWSEFLSSINANALNISNLGQLTRDDIVGLYENARALVFPSISESFGLPLIEASSLRLPIVASELDYVRDVCDPIETFDPNSPVSIARAVKRFLGCQEPALHLKTPAEFWDEFLSSERV